jgi:hypothetical protein
MGNPVSPGDQQRTPPKRDRGLTRREFTRAQKVAMIKRAMDGTGRVLCEGCGLNITGKAIEFDHIIPEALVLDKSRELDVEDGRVLGRDCCHRSPGGKTAIDLADIAEAKRREARHFGIRPGQTSPSRSFARSQPQHSASRPLTKPAAWRRDDL